MSTPTVRSFAFDDLDATTAYAVWRLRQDVFVVEQACAYPDLDGRDLEPGTRHLVLLDRERLAGYLRILDDDDDGDGVHRVRRIGRVVLDPAYRGRGLADVLMRAAVAEIGDQPSRLDAQAPLAGWYASFGYVVTGPEFLDDGIPHLPMRRDGTPA